MTPWLTIRERWVPKEWDPTYIGTRLTQLTKELGLVPLVDGHAPVPWRKGWFSNDLHAEVRRRTSLSKKSAEGWHQDGDTTEGANMNHALVLWASKTPTEFNMPSGIVAPKPFELVIVRNLIAPHRRPEGAPFKRWMFRQRVEVPGWKELP